jgi:hypothetical protein
MRKPSRNGIRGDRSREQRSGPAHFLEPDFWPGITSRLPVIRPVAPTALILLPEPDTPLTG